jgi:predicted RNA-binding Zn ribbon-like protein
MSRTEASGRVFELVGGHPALDLVNTLDWRFRASGPEELLCSYNDVLGFTRQSGLMLASQASRLADVHAAAAMQVLEHVRELRETAAQVFYAALDGGRPTQSWLKRLESFFREAHGHRHLRWRAPRLEWELPESPLSPELPLWILSLSTEQLMESENMQRLRACDNPECRWLFLDTSKNHTRRWCDMKICGNRIKARRFKALHKI